MTALIVSCVAVAVAVASVLASKRTFLTLAKAEEILAGTDRSLAESLRRQHPERAVERLAAAARHDVLAAKYRRRAWPWKPKEEWPS